MYLMRMASTYNSWLVCLLVLVAIEVRFTAWLSAPRVAKSQRGSARRWIGIGAVVMGCGIWTIHFVGTALSLTVARTYGVPTTILWLTIVSATSGFALVILRDRRRGIRCPLHRALVRGSGITAKHYTELSAISATPRVSLGFINRTVRLRPIRHTTSSIVSMLGAIVVSTAPAGAASAGPPVPTIGSAEATGSSAVHSIVIGVSNVQSGPSMKLGTELLSGSQASFDATNRSGGLYGRELTVSVKDDRYEPNRAVQNTQQLIADAHVLFLFDYVGTPTLVRTLPLLKYHQDENIVNVAPLTGAEPQRRPPYDAFVFNIRASYAQETQALVRYFYARGYRRIGILAQADAYGKSGELGIERALSECQSQAAIIVTYTRNHPYQASMQAQVLLLHDAHVDAILVVGVYEAAAAFIRDARVAGWEVPIGNLSFVNASAMLQQLRQTSQELGHDLTDHLINSQVIPSPDDTRYPLVVDYRAHLPNKAVSFIGLEGWLNAVVVTEALRRAGPNPTRLAFIHAMESLGGFDPGIGTGLEFSPSNHQGLHRVWLTRTEAGRWVSEQTP